MPSSRLLALFLVEDGALIMLHQQYAPKDSNFGHLAEDDTMYMMSKFNNRPRKYLGFKVPNEVMFEIKPTIALAS